MTVFGPAVKVTMPVSSSGYVLNFLTELEFIVVEARIDACLKTLDTRVSCFELRASIQASSPMNEFW